MSRAARPSAPHTAINNARKRLAPIDASRKVSSVVIWPSGCFGSTAHTARRIAGTRPPGADPVRTTSATGAAALLPWKYEAYTVSRSG